MKAKKLFWTLAAAFAALSMSVAFSSCEKKDKGDNDDVIIEEDEIVIPTVEAPGEGKTTIVLYIPQSSCDEAIPYILGVLPAGEKWSNEPDNEMEFIGNDWWKVTLDALTAENATNFKFRMEDGAGQWSMEPKGSYTLLEGADQYINVKADEANNLLAVADCNNQVLFVKSGKWSTTPCTEAVPAGKAKFIFTLTGENPGKDIIFTGNFGAENNEWAASDRVMTKEADGTYSWEGDYPENFRFKVLVKDAAGIGNANDEGQLWMAGDDKTVEAESGSVIKFEGCFDGLCPEVEEEAK